jgi:hypothetical protein
VDREILAVELAELTTVLVDYDIDVSITGFQPAEVEAILTDHEEKSTDPADELGPQWAQAPTISRAGDLWLLGKHRLLCGDSRDPLVYARLIGGPRAAMAFLDPPAIAYRPPARW